MLTISIYAYLRLIGTSKSPIKKEVNGGQFLYFTLYMALERGKRENTKPLPLFEKEKKAIFAH